MLSWHRCKNTACNALSLIEYTGIEKVHLALSLALIARSTQQKQYTTHPTFDKENDFLSATIFRMYL